MSSNSPPTSSPSAPPPSTIPNGRSPPSSIVVDSAPIPSGNSPRSSPSHKQQQLLQQQQQQGSNTQWKRNSLLQRIEQLQLPTNTSASFSRPAGKGAPSRLLTEGWLLKLGGQVKKFKKRFFRINGQRLEYYRKPPNRSGNSSRRSSATSVGNDSDGVDVVEDRLGVIPISGAKLTVFDKSIYGRENVFGIQPHRSKRIFVLIAASLEERDKWLETLKPLVDKRARDRKYGIKYRAQHDSIKEGFIERFSEEKEKWGERYILLSSKQISFKKEQHGNQAGSSITIDSTLSVHEENEKNLPKGMVRDKDKDDCTWHYFVISCPNGKRPQYVFRMKEGAERDEWITAISTVIEQQEGRDSVAGGPDGSRPPTSVDAPPSPLMGSTRETKESPSSLPTVSMVAKSHNYKYSDSESEDLSEMSLDSDSEIENEESLPAGLQQMNFPSNMFRKGSGVTDAPRKGTGTETTPSVSVAPSQAPTAPSASSASAPSSNPVNAVGPTSPRSNRRGRSSTVGSVPAIVIPTPSTALPNSLAVFPTSADAPMSANLESTTRKISTAASPRGRTNSVDVISSSERATISELSSTSKTAASTPSSASPSIATRSISNAVPPTHSPPNEAVSRVRLLEPTNPLTQRPTQRVVREGWMKRGSGVKGKQLRPDWLRVVGWVLQLFNAKDETKPKEEVHLIGTLCKAVEDSETGFPFSFVLIESFAARRTFYFIASDAEERDTWVFLLDLKHSFSPHGLPRYLNPKVHVNMKYSPDAKALNAITVNGGNEVKEEEEDDDDNTRESMSYESRPPAVSLTPSNIPTESQARDVSRSFIKGAVSKKKRRFIVDGFDLDLTYVTDRIIAMGFPAESLERLYRNDMQDVRRFFDMRHSDHYKVYNLCSERKYDHGQFHGRVVEFPFDDHNTPAFENMPYFCADVADWLNAHQKNICVVHCKAGKGRTGLMIAVFLLYLGEWRTADEALRYYAFARTKNQKGVTIPSQIRYVHYFEHYLTISRAGGQLPPPTSLRLARMKFSKSAPSFESMETICRGVERSSKDFPLKVVKNKDGSVEYVPIPLKGEVHSPYIFVTDFYVEFYKKKTFGGKARVMSFWLHTQFIENLYLKLTKAEIDKVNKKKEAHEFEVEIFFEEDDSYTKQQEKEQQELRREAVSMAFRGKRVTRYLEKWEDQTQEFYMWIKDEKKATRGHNEKPEIKDFVLCCCDMEKMPTENPKEMDASMVRPKDTTTVYRFSPSTFIMVGWTHEIWRTHALAKVQAYEDRSFSIIGGMEPSAFQMHLEASTEREMALWLEGIKAIYETAGSVAQDKVTQQHENEEKVEPTTPTPSVSAVASTSDKEKEKGKDRSSPTLKPAEQKDSTQKEKEISSIPSLPASVPAAAVPSSSAPLPVTESKETPKPAALAVQSPSSSAAAPTPSPVSSLYPGSATSPSATPSASPLASPSIPVVRKITHGENAISQTVEDSGQLSPFVRPRATSMTTRRRVISFYQK